MATVLIVDDAAFMRASLKNLLEKNGFSVVGEAADGDEAVGKYASLNPDIVTMDITMPNKDGLHSLMEIKKMNPQAVVIMVSAMGQENFVRAAVANGAKGFIVKPFREDTIQKTFLKYK